MSTGIAILGCGYVADLYHHTLNSWSHRLALKGIWDKNPDRVKAFSDHCSLPVYDSFDALLEDPDVEIVLNLTNPYEHYETSRKILEAGKHVYTEKPLAMDFEEAKALVALAVQEGLEIGCAPSTLLGTPAQTLWKAVRENVAGSPRLVYVEMDDGCVHKIGYENWVSSWGVQWPAEDEFNVGCTMEHAGYVVSWLSAMFGPVIKMVSDACLCIPDKGMDTPKDYTTPDAAISILTFESGIMARLSISIIAEHDHRFRIFCDEGTLSVHEVWDFNDKVKFDPILTKRWQRGLTRIPGAKFTKTIEPARRGAFKGTSQGAQIDFCVGLADMAEALEEGKRPRMNHDFGLHVTEVSLAMQNPDIFGNVYEPTTQFDPIEPMPWAK